MDIMEEFCDTVLPVVDQLEQQIIHGDLNDQKNKKTKMSASYTS